MLVFEGSIPTCALANIFVTCFCWVFSLLLLFFECKHTPSGKTCYVAVHVDGFLEDVSCWHLST